MKITVKLLLPLMLLACHDLSAKPPKYRNSRDRVEMASTMPDEGNAAFRNEYRQALRGNASAQNEVGVAYFNGGYGVSRNPDASIVWFRKAAEQGHVLAISNVGLQYYHGEGVEQDYKQAFDYFKKAAEMGNSEAMGYLGKFYANGYYVDVDFALAAFWHRKAVSLPDLDSRNDAAWFFATVEDPEFLDPEFAIKLMENLVFIRAEHNSYDTLAAAYAANGEFAKAIEAEMKAIRIGLETDAESADIEGYKQRMALYKFGERFVYYQIRQTPNK